MIAINLLPADARPTHFRKTCVTCGRPNPVARKACVACGAVFESRPAVRRAGPRKPTLLERLALASAVAPRARSHVRRNVFVTNKAGETIAQITSSELQEKLLEREGVEIDADSMDRCVCGALYPAVHSVSYRLCPKHRKARCACGAEVSKNAIRTALRNGAAPRCWTCVHGDTGPSAPCAGCGRAPDNVNKRKASRRAVAEGREYRCRACGPLRRPQLQPCTACGCLTDGRFGRHGAERAICLTCPRPHRTPRTRGRTSSPTYVCDACGGNKNGYPRRGVCPSCWMRRRHASCVDCGITHESLSIRGLCPMCSAHREALGLDAQLARRRADR
jgi:ribosomal protein S14